MGCFSWMDCKDSKKQIRIGDKCILLVPREFSNEYGNKIEGRYDGYGNIGGFDVYELSAIFNRKYINESNLEAAPTIDQYGGLWEWEKDQMRIDGKTEEEITKADKAEQKRFYNQAMNRRKTSINRLYDFRDGILSDDEMEAKYGEEWLREIGIDISCYDDQQARLLYPIKITHDESISYEDCEGFSVSDINQGC